MLNNGGSKRRIPPSHTNVNSYGNNINMSESTIFFETKQKQTTNFFLKIDLFDQSHHHPHHHHHPPPPPPPPPPPTHYQSFYPEMVVQSVSEPVDLAAAAEYDKERQTIEKCLSKLSQPIVNMKFIRNTK